MLFDTCEIKVALLGNVSAGKTTVLNALFGDKYGEVSMKRTTAGINYFRIVAPNPTTDIRNTVTNEEHEANQDEGKEEDSETKTEPELKDESKDGDPEVESKHEVCGGKAEETEDAGVALDDEKGKDTAEKSHEEENIELNWCPKAGELRTPESTLEEIMADNKKLRESDRVQEKWFDIELKENLVKMRKDTNLVLVDIPGINEAGASSKYKDYVNEKWDTFDCVVLVMDGKQGVNTEDQVFLLKLVRYNLISRKDLPVIILFNKVDDPEDQEQMELVREAQEEIDRIFGNKSPSHDVKKANNSNIEAKGGISTAESQIPVPSGGGLGSNDAPSPAGSGSLSASAPVTGSSGAPAVDALKAPDPAPFGSVFGSPSPAFGAPASSFGSSGGFSSTAPVPALAGSFNFSPFGGTPAPAFGSSGGFSSTAPAPAPARTGGFNFSPFGGTPAPAPASSTGFSFGKGSNLSGGGSNANSTANSKQATSSTEGPKPVGFFFAAPVPAPKESIPKQNDSPPVKSRIRFIPVSAMYAFIHQSASHMTFEQFQRFFDKDLISKTGRYHLGQRKWNKLTEEERLKETYEIITDPAVHLEAIQDSSFDKFHAALCDYVGGTEVQSELIEKQIEVAIDNVKKGGQMLFSVNKNQEAMVAKNIESIFSLTQAFRGLKVAEERAVHLQAAFWTSYSSMEQLGFRHLDNGAGPNVVSVLNKCMDELVSFHQVSMKLRWDKLDYIVGRMKNLIRRLLVLLIDKDSKHGHDTRILPRVTSPEAGQTFWYMSSLAWRELWGSIAILAYDKTFCMTFGKEKVMIDGQLVNAETKWRSRIEKIYPHAVNGKLPTVEGKQDQYKCPNCSKSSYGRTNVRCEKCNAATFSKYNFQDGRGQTICFGPKTCLNCRNNGTDTKVDVAVVGCAQCKMFFHEGSCPSECLANDCKNPIKNGHCTGPNKSNMTSACSYPYVDVREGKKLQKYSRLYLSKITGTLTPAHPAEYKLLVPFEVPESLTDPNHFGYAIYRYCEYVGSGFLMSTFDAHPSPAGLTHVVEGGFSPGACGNVATNQRKIRAKRPTRK